MKPLFEAIKTAIESTINVPVEWYSDQLTNEEILELPKVYVTIQPITWQDRGGDLQVANVVATLSVVTESLGSGTDAHTFGGVDHHELVTACTLAVDSIYEVGDRLIFEHTRRVATTYDHVLDNFEKTDVALHIRVQDGLYIKPKVAATITLADDTQINHL